MNFMFEMKIDMQTSITPKRNTRGFKETLITLANSVTSTPTRLERT